jgi:hypothetical protein
MVKLSLDEEILMTEQAIKATETELAELDTFNTDNKTVTLLIVGHMGRLNDILDKAKEGLKTLKKLKEKVATTP